MKITLYITLIVGILLICGSCKTFPPVETDPELKPFSLSSWNGKRMVQTRYGQVYGYPDGEGVYAWYSIPYAKPPVGELRWRAPRDPEPWTGVRAKRTMPDQCIQYDAPAGNCITGSEDCLYLNIWRPVTADDALPVYVWIHGGGNSTGSADQLPDYHGTEFVKKIDAVYVSVQYRLGVFGWFTHPALRHDQSRSAEDKSGNYGTLDLIKALEWVQNNIEAFGGDPGNVTIAGESAGAFNVVSLLMSPLTEGLFHKAVARSGGIVTSTIEEGDQTSNNLLAALLRKDGYKGAERSEKRSTMTDEEIRGYLYGKPGRQILKCFQPAFFGMLPAPTIFKEGTVIPVEGKEVFKSGDYPSKVPVMIGCNQDEVKLFMAWDRKLVKDKQKYTAATAYGSNMWIADGCDGLARLLASNENQPPVYAYHFQWGSLDENGESPLPGNTGYKFGACHALEIPFFAGTASKGSPLFNVFFFTGKNKPGRILLEDAVLSYLSDFISRSAQTGNGSNGNTSSALSGSRHGSAVPLWQEWDNTAGGFKSIRLDAGYEKPNITTSTEEMTKDRAVQLLREQTTPEQFEEIKTMMDESVHSIENLYELNR